MNFLAHFHLAWPDQGLVVGGLEGDYYKGPMRGDLPPGIERGVRLHRSIDAFTDQHPGTLALRGELPAELRRYAGIIIDLSFDHYLSYHWTRYSPLPLADFNREIYAMLAAQRQALSQPAREMQQRLQQFDILNLYTQWETVTATARRIGQRFARGNPFLDIDEQLVPFRSLLEDSFLDFYPQLQSFARDQVNELR